MTYFRRMQTPHITHFFPTGKYLVEVWKATGMDMEHVKFVWSSDEISRNAHAYWTQVEILKKVKSSILISSGKDTRVLTVENV